MTDSTAHDPRIGRARRDVADTRLLAYLLSSDRLTRGERPAPIRQGEEARLTRSRRRPSRGMRPLAGRRHRIVAVVAVALAVFVAATLLVLVWPPLGGPQRADAIVSLNGPEESRRRAEAVSLAARGYAPVLLFSQGRSETRCPVLRRIKVVCFVPNPGRTVGEAEWVGRYARRHHLKSLLVVAGQTQTLRALLLMGRCFDGTIHAVGVRAPTASLPYDIVYGWGSLGRALLLDRHC